MTLCTYLCYVPHHLHMDLETEGDAEELAKVALKQMKKSLPAYIVNCFVAAGFHTLPTIAETHLKQIVPANSALISKRVKSDGQTSSSSAVTNFACTMGLLLAKWQRDQKHSRLKALKENRQCEVKMCTDYTAWYTHVFTGWPLL